MAEKIRLLKLFIALSILLSLAIVFLSSPPIASGVISRLGESNSISANLDLAGVSVQIYDDAERVSKSLCGDNQKVVDAFTNEILSTYVDARDCEVVVIFNPGGWGWRFVNDSPNWSSIFKGMKEYLDLNNVDALFLEHRRSDGTLQSYVDEYVSVIGIDSFKARVLATRINFLTEHISGIKIIITGESNGTVICDEVMKILHGNPQVYSIQTGTPFWHEDDENSRTLIINNNGIVPDTFANGDFFTMISRNVETLFGFSTFDASKGHVLNLFAAPGHTYTWEDLTVRNKIENFLTQNIISCK